MPRSLLPVRIAVDFGSCFTSVLVHGSRGLLATRLPVSSVSLQHRAQQAVQAALTLLGQTAEVAGPLELTYVLSDPTRSLLAGEPQPVALLTTAGFTDLLQIGRQEPAPPYTLVPTGRPQLLTPESCLPVFERIAADGSIVEPLIDEALQSLRAQVQALGVKSVAITLLHSYREPVHEQTLAAALTELGLWVSLSSEVLPIPREFERASATVLDAAAATCTVPIEKALLAALPAGSRVRAVQSDGVARSGTRPLRTLFSSQAATLLAAQRVAALHEQRHCLFLGVGAHQSFVAHNEHCPDSELKHRAQLGGLPLGVPSLISEACAVGDLTPFTVDTRGQLRLGQHQRQDLEGQPTACGRDAALLLGRFVSDELLAAGLAVDLALSRQRLQALGDKLTPPCAAEAVAVELLTQLQASLEVLLRRVSIESGHDPSQYVLVCAGGAARLFAEPLAQALGIQSVLLPPVPGLLAAYGALCAPVVRERQQVLHTEASGAQQKGLLAATLRALTEGLRGDLAREQKPASDPLPGFMWSADLRYAGQSHALTLLGIGDGEPAQDVASDLVVRFHQEHHRRYGFTVAERTIELVSVRVWAQLAVASPPLGQLAPAGCSGGATRAEQQASGEKPGPKPGQSGALWLHLA